MAEWYFNKYQTEEPREWPLVMARCRAEDALAAIEAVGFMIVPKEPQPNKDLP